MDRVTVMNRENELIACNTSRRRTTRVEMSTLRVPCAHSILFEVAYAAMPCTLRAHPISTLLRVSRRLRLFLGLIRLFSCVNKPPCTLDRVHLRRKNPRTLHRLPSVFHARATNPP